MPFCRFCQALAYSMLGDLALLQIRSFSSRCNERYAIDVDHTFWFFGISELIKISKQSKAQACV